MKNRFSFLRLGCLALLCASSPFTLFGVDQNRRAALKDANKTSEEYRKLFSTLLNPNGVDFEEFGTDSRAISVIGMFSDEKQSGAELQVMHWINFKSDEDECDEGFNPVEIDSVRERARAKKHVLDSELEQERLRVNGRVTSQRVRLDQKMRSEAEKEISALKEKNKKRAEDKLLQEQKEDIKRMLELERRMQKQEEDAKAIAELEAKIQKQELDRRKQDLFENTTDEVINEAESITRKKKKKLQIKNPNAKVKNVESELSEDLPVNSSNDGETPLFQGSLWRISPSGDFNTDGGKIRAGVRIPGVDEAMPLESGFSSKEKSVILESLDRIERTHFLNRSTPNFRQASLGEEMSSGLYPKWASGSKLLEKALDKCNSRDEYLVLAFSFNGISPPRDSIVKDLRNYGISPGKIRECTTFVECDSSSKNLDRKVEELLVMAGLWNNPGYVIIELPGRASKSSARIVRACPMSASRDLKSKMFSFANVR